MPSPKIVSAVQWNNKNLISYFFHICVYDGSRSWEFFAHILLLFLQKKWKSKKVGNQNYMYFFWDLYIKYTLYRLIQKNALALWGSNSSTVPPVNYYDLKMLSISSLWNYLDLLIWIQEYHVFINWIQYWTRHEDMSMKSFSTRL